MTALGGQMKAGYTMTISYIMYQVCSEEKIDFCWLFWHETAQEMGCINACYFA